MVVMAAVIVAVLVMVKVLVRAMAVINMPLVVEVLGIGVWADVPIDTVAGADIIVVAAVLIALEFAVPTSYLVDVLSSMVVNALIDVLAGVLTGIVPGIGAGVLADANGNVFASLMTVLGFVSTKPFGEFCC